MAQHHASERRAQAGRYSAALALAREGKEPRPPSCSQRWREGGGYGLLAAFEEAELLAKAGDRKAAIAAYDRLAASSTVGREFRDLAVLLSVMHGLPDGDPKAAIERLRH